MGRAGGRVAKSKWFCISYWKARSGFIGLWDCINVCLVRRLLWGKMKKNVVNRLGFMTTSGRKWLVACATVITQR